SATINVTPNPSISDEKIKISIQGLTPSEDVSLHAFTRVTKKCFYESFAQYKVPSSGIVDLTKDASVDGMYTGVEPMGLIWSMEQSPIEDIVRLIHRDVTTPQEVCLRVYDGPLDRLREKQDKVIAETTVERLYMTPGVKRMDVRDNGLVATLFLPPGDGPFPGIITMMGGIPGTLEFKAALFASHGFASLALVYCGVDGFPTPLETMDMQYFQKAVNFMLNHKKVDAPHGIGVVGICKGAQIAYCMADCLSGIRCVVGVNGAPFSLHSPHSHCGRHWPASKFVQSSSFNTEEKIYPFVKSQDDPELLSRLFDIHKRPHISYLVIASLDDQNITAEYFANLCEKLFKSTRHPDYKILRYPGTGHLLDPPYSAPCIVAKFELMNAVCAWGGTTKPHAKAQEDSWNEIMSFLRLKLCNPY
uniref:BAAT/Acyl-CoA thioester hydrolase C-terminal domain-containing protein n=1 Tax=Ciona intestinalis TaxID=7719 RepID=F6VDE1_CIOIN